MNMRTVHSVNSLVSCVMALFLNLVLLWLVLKRAPKEMQVYSRILIQTILVDIALAAIMELTQPIDFMNDGWALITFNGPLVRTIEPASLRFLLFTTWLFFYMFSIFGLAVQFVYRYLVLAKNAHISMPRYLAMLCVPAIAELVTFFVCGLCAIPKGENAVVPGEKASQLLGDGDPIYVVFAVNTTDLLSIIATGLLILLQILCYTMISVCGYLVVKFVRENSKLNPAHKEMNRQLTLNLIIQAILPFLLCAVNIFDCITAVYFNMSNSLPMQLVQVLSLAPTHWLPMLNPLVTMVVVKPFRRTLLCCVKKTTAVKNVVAVQKAQVAAAKNEGIARRPRVVTLSIANHKC